MKSYFIRRLLLIPPTLLGITFLVFSVTRFVPGGPMDRMLQQATKGNSQEGKRASASQSLGGLSEEQIEEIEEQFGLDQPLLKAYGQWLGILPREIHLSKAPFGVSDDEKIDTDLNSDLSCQVVLHQDGRAVTVTRDHQKITRAVFLDSQQPISSEGWKARIQPAAERISKYKQRNPNSDAEVSYPDRAILFKTHFSGILQGDFGRSTVYNDSVTDMMLSKVPVATYFGLLTAVLTYLVCLPLGILKALKHRSFIDSFSSILIFIGYSIPGFALGAILLVHLGARLNWFPLFGLTSPNFDDLSRFEQFKDLAHHTALPLLCYMVGSFAMLTMMTKNSLMDHLAADYIRTAVAKGASFRRAVFGHAFRNSMIPVATSLGSLIEIFIGGSMLIESIFDIQGFGLLQYQAVIARDMPVIMGTLTVSAFLMLLGHVISDVIVAMVDPRIRFN